LNDQRQPIDARLKQDILTGMRLILARAEVLNCQLNADLTVSVRRDVRPPRLPYVVCGQESPTNWDIMELPLIEENQLGVTGIAPIINYIVPTGLTAAVDTSSAEFQITPVYTARITGPRIMEIPSGDGSTLAILEGLINIPVEQARAKSFTIELLLLLQPFNQNFSAINLWHGESGTAEQTTAFLNLFKEWTVVWMGVES
jgi:hypothetical protein